MRRRDIRIDQQACLPRTVWTQVRAVAAAAVKKLAITVADPEQADPFVEDQRMDQLRDCGGMGDVGSALVGRARVITAAEACGGQRWQRTRGNPVCPMR